MSEHASKYSIKSKFINNIFNVFDQFILISGHLLKNNIEEFLTNFIWKAD